MKPDLEKLRALCLGATPGPWESRIHGDGKYYPVKNWVPGRSFKVAEHSRENSDFIAAANPQAVLELLDKLESAVKLCQTYSKMLRRK